MLITSNLLQCLVMLDLRKDRDHAEQYAITHEESAGTKGGMVQYKLT